MIIIMHSLAVHYRKKTGITVVSTQLSMSVLQGGSCFPFMAEAVYKYFCTGDSTGIVVPTDKVAHHSLRFALVKVGHIPVLYYMAQASRIMQVNPLYVAGRS